MKDKILPLDYDQYSVEELTEKANKIIESLEKENDLNNSVDSYQELLKLNNIIEKKFHKNFKSIGEETNKKVKEITKKMKKQLNKIAKDTNIFLKKYINSQKYSQLKSPMKYGLFPGGKIRSKILIDLGSLFSIDYKTLIIVGSAVECIHAYSLIHDDLLLYG